MDVDDPKDPIHELIREKGDRIFQRANAKLEELYGGVIHMGIVLVLVHPNEPRVAKVSHIVTTTISPNMIHGMAKALQAKAIAMEDLCPDDRTLQ